MQIVVITGFYPGERAMGGAEYQSMLLAKGFAQRGHPAAFFATRAGQLNHFQADGVSIEEMPGIRIMGIRAYRQHMADLIQKYRPDICYIRIFPEIAEILPVCQRFGVAVVTVTCGGMEARPLLLGQHPRETLGHIRTGDSIRHFRSFRSIRLGDAHVCNTQEFANLVKKWHPHHTIQTIYNATPVPSEAEIHSTPGNRIIWVNNIKRVKRPEWYIELARRLPDYEFTMIGKIYDSRYGRAIQKKINNGPVNLDYRGRLPIDVVNQEIRTSDILVYTSIPGHEGFGNSFLQAWSRAVPTVSTYPLDGILEREGIGRYAHTMDELVQSIDQLMANPQERMLMGARARAYVTREHQIDTMVNQYLTLFSNVIITSEQSQFTATSVES